MMYGILGEDDSDAQTLKVLVKRLAGDESLTVKAKGYGGSGKLLKDGARALRLFKALALTRFIVCHDADGPDPNEKCDLVMEKSVKPSGLAKDCCIVIPVQELEAWILADIECGSKVFGWWRPAPIQNPEGIPKPKGHIERLCYSNKPRRRYNHAVDNERMARHLDLDKVARKCAEFRKLRAFVPKAS
jgi:hypothetical protein